jgi:hypothetical protein
MTTARKTAKAPMLSLTAPAELVETVLVDGDALVPAAAVVESVVCEVL